MSVVDDESRKHLVEIRRKIHQNPEISGKEHDTAQLVARQLREYGIDNVVEGVADTGVVAWISGPADGTCVVLRADLDALPIVEADRGQEYISRNPGVHHGCGHDGHVAILLSVARALQARRRELGGSVLLLFQPAEERGGGARRMLDASPWPAELRPSRSLGLHITTELPVGTVDVRSGPVLASAQSVDIRFSSTGGHAAQPHLSPDPVVCAAEFIMSAQTVVSRSLDSRSNVVLGLSCIHGGHTRSAIPTDVTIEGTVRTYSDDDLGLVRTRVAAIAAGIAAAHGCEADVDFKDDMYPVGINDPSVSDIVGTIARGLETVDAVTADVVESGADDMAEILADFPGCYFRLGAGNPDRGFTAPMHSPEFDFDEDAMPIGVELLVESVFGLQRDPSDASAYSAGDRTRGTELEESEV